MYSLFWKIFITYWFTILIVELFTAWITADLSELEIHPILEHQNEEFVASSELAVSILKTKGLPGLRAWLNEINTHKAIDNIFVFNQNLQEVNNKLLPEHIKAILDSDIKNYKKIDRYNPIKNILTFKTTSLEGDSYLLISTFEHPHPIKYLLAPQRVAFSIIASGLICFLLASYFTSPLRKLRNSTQMLSLNEFKPISLDNLRNRNDEFGALAIDFENMTTRLSDLLNSQKQLLRDISHELRSPLTRIQVALDLARNKFKPTGIDELNRIEHEIENLDFLIRELLTFVRMDAHNTDSKASVDIVELLKDIVTDLNYEKQTTLTDSTINIQCPSSAFSEGQAQLLHRALENIIRNASYYSPVDGVIRIECAVVNNTICIQIADNGPGVPENMLERIFDPFVRVSVARESDTGGNGIGLAIAKRVIDIHQGKITASNRTNGNGLIVTIELPLATG